MKRKTLILNVVDNKSNENRGAKFYSAYIRAATDWMKEYVCGNFDHAKNQIMIEKSYLVSFHEVSDRRDSKIK